MLDFNPYSIALYQDREALRTSYGTDEALPESSIQGERPESQEQIVEGSTERTNNTTTVIMNEPSVIPKGLLFKHDVRTELPYLEVETGEAYACDGVLMDDSRIVLVKVSRVVKFVI